MLNRGLQLCISFKVHMYCNQMCETDVIEVLKTNFKGWQSKQNVENSSTYINLHRSFVSSS